MNRKQILQFHPQLRLFLQYLRGVSLCLIVLTSILYFLAVYCLLKEQMVAAISLASFAAIIFHLSQKYILIAVKYWLSRDEKNRKMLHFLDGEMRDRLNQNQSDYKNSHEIKAFFSLLEKAIKVTEDSNRKK